MRLPLQQTCVAMVLFLLTFRPIVQAQQGLGANQAQGESPLASYSQGEIDNVNPANGSIYLKIPLLSYPQRGHLLRLNFNIYYNSPNWSLKNWPEPANANTSSPPTWIFQNQGDPALGGAYVARDQYLSFGTDTTSVPFSNGAQGYFYQIYGNSTFLSNFVREPNGAKHYYSDWENVYCYNPSQQFPCGHMPSYPATIYTAFDGSGFRPVSPDGTGKASTVIGPDGVTYSTSTSPNSHAGVISDLSGNSISSSSTGWIDTANRSIPGSLSGPGTPVNLDNGAGALSNSDEPIPGVQSSLPQECSGATDARQWSVPALGNTTNTYYLCYTSFSYTTAFQTQQAFSSDHTYNATQEGTGTAELLTTVVLPDHTTYTFTYDQQYLSLTQLTTPTDAKIVYTWQTVPMSEYSIPQGRVLQSRTIYPGAGQPPRSYYYTWLTATSGAEHNPYSENTIVTDPGGNDVEYFTQMAAGIGEAYKVVTFNGCAPDDTASHGSGQACDSSRSALLQTVELSGNSGAVGPPDNSPTSDNGYGNSYAFPSHNAARAAYYPDTVKTTLANGQVSEKITINSPTFGTCQYVANYATIPHSSQPSMSDPDVETKSNCFWINQPANESIYDYGSNNPGSLLRQISTAYKWQDSGTSNTYFNANQMDLPEIVSTLSGAQTDPSLPSASTLVAQIQYGYDSQGNQTSVTSGIPGEQITTGTVFNANGTPSKSIDANNYPTTDNAAAAYTYDDSVHMFVTRIDYPTTTNGMPHFELFQRDLTTGKLTQHTDQNGQVTTYSYVDPHTQAIDRRGRLHLVTYPATFDGASQTSQAGSTQYNYNDAPDSLAITEIYAKGGGLSIQKTTSFDNLGELTRTSLDTAPGNPILTAWQYDSSGQVLSVTNPYSSNADLTYGLTAYAYDGLRRKTSETHSDGTSLGWIYTGNQVLFTDESTNPKQTLSDALGRLTDVNESGGTCINTCLGLNTHYTYDALSNLKKVNQTGSVSCVSHGSFGGSQCTGDTARIRQFTYNSLSHLVTALNPETGIICYGLLSQGSCTGGYDANGNLLYKTDARGLTTSYTYDALNRLTHKGYSDGTRQEAYGYDGKNEDGTAINSLPATNGIGRLSHTSDQVSVASDYAYDAMGRLTDKRDCTPSDCSYGHLQHAAYDLAGNMTDLTYPDGSTITQSFDGAGRLSSVSAGTTAQPGSPFISGLTYLPSGAPQTITYGNGVVENFTQNSRLQPCHQTATSGSLNLLDRQYFYNTNDTTNPCTSEANNNGNIWHIVDGLPNATNNQNFQYDSLNRLTHFEGPNMSGAYRSQSFGYDSFGNISATQAYNNAPSGNANVVGTPNARMFANPNFNSSSGSPYDANNRLVDATFDCTSLTGTHYDAAGNIQCDGSNTDLNARQYLWDAESRISAMNSQQNGNTYYRNAFYTYDANGNRMRSDQIDTSGNSTSWREYSFFNGQMLSEKDQTGSWTDYIYANGQKIAKVDQKKSILHLRATRPSSTTTGVKGYLSGVGGLGLTLAQGDRISLDFFQNLASAGGFWLFTDNSAHILLLNDASTGTSFSTNNTTGVWQHLTAALDSYAGQTISSMYAGTHTGAAGDYDMQYANIVVTHGDGSVTPIFTGQSGAIVNISPNAAAAGNTNLSSDTEPTPVSPAQGTSYYLADHLNTTQIELSPGGWPTWQGQFAPFGQELDDQNTAMRYKFSGKERDTESGLDYFGARYYASNMGRFMSPDWAAKAEPVPYAKLDNPQSLNLYSYVKNNPLSQADPDGHCCEEEDPEEEMREEPLSETVGRVARAAHVEEFNEREQRIRPGSAAFTPEQVDEAEAAGRAKIHDMLHPNGDMLDQINNKEPVGPYKRPNNATTPEQRESVQGKPCATCGATGQKNKADHIDPLVEQHYRGGIDKDKMRSPDAVRPQCTTCSAQQGGYLRQFSQAMKKLFGFN